MSAPKTGGSAFPLNSYVLPNGQVSTELPGMTLRDWFAGQALGGIIVATAANLGVTCEDLADEAYQHADAMIAEREKSSPSKT